MTAADSWVQLADWFKSYAVQEGYTWASFFPEALTELASRDAAQGLYVHRWATTAIVSRFGTHPDWADGPRVELTPLPDARVELVAYRPYNQRVRRWIVSAPLSGEELDPWLMFVAGDGPLPQ